VVRFNVANYVPVLTTSRDSRLETALAGPGIRSPTGTRYAFRGTLGRGIFQSALKSSNLGHFDQTAPNSYII
jgi:hypothetical protein